MSSNLTFKIISIVVMIVILVIVVISKKSDNNKEEEAIAENNDQQPEDSDYLLRRTGLPYEQENKQNDLKKTENNQMKNSEEKIEISDGLKKANREFTKLFLSLSEWEKNKIRGEENPRTPEEEQAYWEEFERRKKEHYELLKNHPEEQHHCVGFDLPTAVEAHKHFHGMLEELWDYGDKCNENVLHTWDDGGRKLCRCHDCGGLVLVQKSEYHGQENDDYYTDYFPVDSVQEAEQLNELYGGWAIEKEWSRKKVFVSNGHVTPNYR